MKVATRHPKTSQGFLLLLFLWMNKNEWISINNNNNNNNKEDVFKLRIKRKRLFEDAQSFKSQSRTVPSW